MKNKKVNQKGKIPNGTATSTLVYYQNALYLYGDDGNFHSDPRKFYKFDLETEIWEIIEAEGVTPSLRIGHLSHVISDSMYIFFGVNFETNLVLDDAYRYEFTTNTWYYVGNFKEHSRYNSQSIQIDNQIYFLFGKNLAGFKNDIIMFKILNNNIDIKVISEQFSSPPARHSHCSALINDHLYIYGGYRLDMNGDMTIYNDLWKFNFYKKQWTVVTYTGEFPSFRINNACLFFEGNMLGTFGGEYEDTYYNDIYFLYEPLALWYKLFPTGISPSPRSSSCLAYYDYKLYIIGGKNKVKGFNDIWQYFYETNTYKQIYHKVHQLLDDIHNCHSWIDPINASDITLMILGGQSFDVIPNKYTYNFTIKEGKILDLSVINILKPIKIKSTISKVGNKLLIIGGYLFDYLTRDPLLVYDLNIRVYKIMT